MWSVLVYSNCSEGTCDGCTFHFLWESQFACPLCTKNNYREIVSACIQGIQVKYLQKLDIQPGLPTMHHFSQCKEIAYLKKKRRLTLGLRWMCDKRILCCVSENHLRVAGATAVSWRRAPATIHSQCMRVPGLLAQIWCFHWSHSCRAADQHQLLFLEEDTQVRLHGFSFIWFKQLVRRCSRYSDNRTITQALRCRLQYKYSKLVMNSSGKECDLPTADSCAIMEGEDAEDDIMYLNKKPFFSKIRAYSREVSNTTIPTHRAPHRSDAHLIDGQTFFFRGHLMDLILCHSSHRHRGNVKSLKTLTMIKCWWWCFKGKTEKNVTWKDVVWQ